MTAQEFNRLEYSDKVEVLWSGGVHLASRESIFFDILLYQVHGFYIEVVYNRVDRKIVKMRTFSSTKLLEPYLAEVDISAVTSFVM
jgi:hypothetical protein